MRRTLLLVALLALGGCEESYPPAEYPPPPDPNAAQPEAMPADDPSVAAAAPQADTYEDTDPAALSDFKTTLDPHGPWVDDPTYGTVWVPSSAEVGADFAPYVTAGHWEYGEDEYVWVSDYDWGWAPFHYGRWVYIAGTGWAWIPGRRYAGAWVTWRVGDEGYEYVGWAPMPPLWYWRGGVVVWLGAPPPAPYIFCETRYVFAPVVATHIVVGERVAVIGGRTRPFVAAGPVVTGRIAGPPPARLGIAAASVPRVAAHPGVARAQQFSRPSTAAALGARKPTVAAPARRRAPAVVPHAAPHSAPHFHPAPHVTPRGGGGRHR